MTWDTIVDGLYVSALGMGMVSAVLVLLAVTVRAVSKGDEWLEARGGFRFGSAEPMADAPVEPAIAELSPPDAHSETERVAAVAVAIALAMEAQQPAIPASSAPSTATPAGDSWLAQGRARQFARQAGASRRAWSRR